MWQVTEYIPLKQGLKREAMKLKKMQLDKSNRTYIPLKQGLKLVSTTV